MSLVDGQLAGDVVDGVVAREEAAAAGGAAGGDVAGVAGSNGMIATGWSSSALAKSAGLISGRFGTPTWLRQ